MNQENKKYVAEEGAKLGQMIYKRVGGQFKQVWEDGDDILNTKMQLEETIKEREGLEKIRRSKKWRKSLEQATNCKSSDEMGEIEGMFEAENTYELTQNLLKAKGSVSLL